MKVPVWAVAADVQMTRMNRALAPDTIAVVVLDATTVVADPNELQFVPSSLSCTVYCPGVVIAAIVNRTFTFLHPAMLYVEDTALSVPVSRPAVRSKY